MEKYIRTESGDIWELDGEVYRKPNCANYVLPDDSAITDREDEMYRLVKAGDLLAFNYGGRYVVEEKQVFQSIDLATGIKDKKACIPSLWKFTPYLQMAKNIYSKLTKTAKNGSLISYG